MKKQMDSALNIVLYWYVAVKILRNSHLQIFPAACPCNTSNQKLDKKIKSNEMNARLGKHTPHVA